MARRTRIVLSAVTLVSVLLATPAAALGPHDDRGNSASRSNDWALPEPMEHGIARAQIFEWGVPDHSIYPEKNIAFVWSSRQLEEPPGVLASRYRTFDLLADPAIVPAEWVRQNHPEWIMYRQDRQTLAYDYPSDPNHRLLPLDYTNPDVRSWYVDNFIDPVIANGYPMAAFDLVNVTNNYERAGHFDANGNWVQMYEPGLDNAQYRRDAEAWLAYLTDYLHAHGVSVTANINVLAFLDPPPERLASAMRMIRTVDMWTNEGGFTKGEEIGLADGEWIKQFMLTRYTVSNRCLTQIALTRSRYLADASDQQVDYAIGNYLLTREDCSMLALTGAGDYGSYVERPELFFDIGKPAGDPWRDSSGAWTRSFTGGLVYVNPSSTRTSLVSLPSGTWTDSNGQTYSGQVSLPPISALVLARG